jgi:hypothetical protein
MYNNDKGYRNKFVLITDLSYHIESVRNIFRVIHKTGELLKLPSLLSSHSQCDGYHYHHYNNY